MEFESLPHQPGGRRAQVKAEKMCPFPLDGVQFREGEAAGRRIVTQYGEWSESTLTPNPTSMRSGSRVGEISTKSIRDMAGCEGVKQ